MLADIALMLFLLLLNLENIDTYLQNVVKTNILLTVSYHSVDTN